MKAEQSIHIAIMPHTASLDLRCSALTINFATFAPLRPRVNKNDPDLLCVAVSLLLYVKNYSLCPQT